METSDYVKKLEEEACTVELKCASIFYKKIT